jgi:2-polyprenyl-3-methyl-5-hydroxy-6-metoxy-1,4-benzoquinol methylase
MKNENWNKALPDELRFWDNWLQTKGSEYPGDFDFRMDPNSEVQPFVAQYLKSRDDRILDVGSGPLTILGKNFNGKKLNIDACDALAKEYIELLEKYYIEPLIKTQYGMVESVHICFDYSYYDIVYAQNCIDHCLSPDRAILSMLQVCKPGGKILLVHEINEAENEHYSGLHQWNFYSVDGLFYISGREFAICINDLLENKAIVETITDNGYIRNIITKL